jgi:hypothetical protein
MKRLAWLATSGLLVAYGLAGALAGCGSDDEVPAASGDDAGDDAASASSSSGSTSSSGGSSSGEVDAAADAQVDPPSSSNPGKLTCGATECDLATADTYCCLRAVGDAGCETANNACNGGAKLNCDEPADCPNANENVCCMRAGGAGGGAVASSQCADACNNGFVLCKTAADCGDAGACNEKTCFGAKVSVCGSPAACQ